jgi:hypothetical protein
MVGLDFMMGMHCYLWLLPSAKVAAGTALFFDQRIFCSTAVGELNCTLPHANDRWNIPSCTVGSNDPAGNARSGSFG